MKSAPTGWALLVFVGVLAGCGRNDVQVYQVAKEQTQTPPVAMPPGHPGHFRWRGCSRAQV